MLQDSGLQERDKLFWAAPADGAANATAPSASLCFSYPAAFAFLWFFSPLSKIKCTVLSPSHPCSSANALVQLVAWIHLPG